MKEPKVEVKSVRFHEGHEGQGVNADVYINGVKTYHVLDDGNGGCLMINLLAYGSKNPELVKAMATELHDYIESLPEKPLDFGHGVIKDDQGNVRMYKISLEDYINELLYAYERKKEQKKIEKLMQTALLFGIPNGGSYRYYQFKKPLSEIPVQHLQTRLNVLVMENCKKGIQVLNTNLKELGLVIN